MGLRLSETNAICLENGVKLIEWLQGFSRSSPKKIEIVLNTTKRFAIRIYTDNNSYRFTCTDTYLGCDVYSRKQRPGESQHRGSDLPDGQFSGTTFLKILGAIIFYEAKDIVKHQEPEVRPPSVEYDPKDFATPQEPQ